MPIWSTAIAGWAASATGAALTAWTPLSISSPSGKKVWLAKGRDYPLPRCKSNGMLARGTGSDSRMKRRMLTFVAVLAIVYLGALALLYVFQRNLMYFPNAARPDAAAAAAEASLREVAYQSADNVELHSLFFSPPSPAAPVLVHFHGNAGNIGDRAGRIVPFVQAGMGVLLAEYRGFGGNDGTPTEQGLYIDGRAAIAYLRQQGVTPERMVFYG